MKNLSRLWLAAAVLLVPALSARGHEGHDHAAADPVVSAAPAPTLSAVPTLEADGSDVQLVALVQEGVLTLYIDRLVDNSPVTAATVSVSANGAAAIPVAAGADGTYRSSAPWAKPGDHALTFTVTGDGVADLLVGTLTVPVVAAPAVVVTGNKWLLPVVLALGGVGMGLLLPMLWRRRSVAAALLLLVAAPILPGVPSATAHEGHDHGTPAPEPVAGNNPRRLPDGSLFVPKATQRLLSIRTQALAPSQVTPTQTLTGRVIADPNRSGRVQALQSGRLMPPEGGFPLPGTAVRTGEVLGYVELVLRAEDGSGISQQMAALDKEVRLAQQQWNRVSNLKGAVSEASIDDARATLDGLLREREAMARAVARRVPLTAPVDGVITISNAVPGLMVEDRDVTVVFEVAAPDALMVEVLSFDGPQSADAQVTAMVKGRAVALSLAGQGVGPTPGATRLLLRADAAAWGTDRPALGSMVQLSLPVGPPVAGLLLPRDALVRGADGLPTVLVHESAQRFIPRAVRVEPAGADSVRLLAGVAEGARIVVRGTSLLNQIR